MNCGRKLLEAGITPATFQSCWCTTLWKLIVQLHNFPLIRIIFLTLAFLIELFSLFTYLLLMLLTSLWRICSVFVSHTFPLNNWPRPLHTTWAIECMGFDLLAQHWHTDTPIDQWCARLKQWTWWVRAPPDIWNTHCMSLICIDMWTRNWHPW